MPISKLTVKLFRGRNMKIGIVRHFKVNCKKRKYMNAEEFLQYVQEYDTAGIIKNPIHIEQEEWDKCYCSNMPRAIQTARSIYRGEIIQSKLLREIDMRPWRMWPFRLPSTIWSMLARVAWYIGDASQTENRWETIKRARIFIERLDANEDVLIVSHGFFLISFIQELRRRGFKGEVPTHIPNGKLYILEKE